MDLDVVRPNGNEKEFIDKALLLGYTELVFLTDNLNYSYKTDKIRLKTAYQLKNQAEIHKSRNRFDYLFAPADRQFFEQKVDFIINSELSDMKDSFHYRRTSLNQVHAKLAKENNIVIVFSFDNILNAQSRKRIQTLGRCIQNSTIVRKYSLRNAAFSMARDPQDMRSRTLLNAFLKVLNL